jgi:homoserine O-acetyltransferase
MQVKANSSNPPQRSEWQGNKLHNPFLRSFLLFALLLTICGEIASAQATRSQHLETAMTLPIEQHDAVYQNYALLEGGRLPQVRIHYATIGTAHRNAAGQIDNAVLLLHWTGASGKAMLSETFQQSLYAPGAPLDASRYFLIIPDNLGHGASTKPSDGLKAQFPAYGYRDLVVLQHKLVTETLGIEHLHAIVGLSMGGMNAWQWAEQYPDAMDGIMPVVALPVHISGRNLLWRQMAARWIQQDPEYRDGNYTSQPQVLNQVGELIRLMIDGVPHLQSVLPDAAATQQFLQTIDQQGSGYDTNDLLYSIQSSRDYAPEDQLSVITTKVYALNFDDDEFNPARLQILEPSIAKIPHAQYAIQPGTAESHGHLTMAHPELWASHVSIFMKSLEAK